jgi:hypothetical protein
MSSVLGGFPPVPPGWALTCVWGGCCPFSALPQSPEIHRRFGTDASFIDVNSAVTPWWRTGFDTGLPGAGTFSTLAHASAELCAFERKTHGGPVFDEGRRHWFWSGLLDGAEAQFGEGVEPDAGDTPLFVDFDLLKIHPLQVNHGMGYYERWLLTGTDIEQPHQLDAYRMQEIIYGHAPFLGNMLWTIPTTHLSNRISCRRSRRATGLRLYGVFNMK